jgi:hypothetical protein
LSQPRGPPQDELKAFITATTKQLREEQTEHLESQIQYLKEAAGRMGRKDWLNILFSSLVTIVVAGVVAPERANELFGVASSLFQPMYQFILQLPGS